MPNQQLIEGSVDIAAAPSVVWSLVSDLKRMGEWSPQCRKMIVFGKDVKVGTRTLNLNGRGKLRWPTNAKVVTFERDKRLAFQIVENRTIWTYDLEPTEFGTRLTESRTAPRGVSKLSNVLTQNVLGGTDNFEVELDGGINKTLLRIKAAAEAA
ncbi:SRPBCC family protein [Aeromicrobium sp. UC242_57]|uniref:SRPBCC family protein n=1 Tax=Aeromicrobium sp. UC242_57 TaxID=3374624 RepID=UPI0037B21E8F